MKKIKITLQSEEASYTISTYQNEYRSLMHLIKDNSFLEDFGECGGVGRCCTCVVQIISKDVILEPFDGNELNTLKKHNLNLNNSRLSCQIMIEPSIEGLIVKIDQD